MEHYSAEIVLDSIIDDTRVTTMKISIPKFILAELNTHRVFSRNTGSSRAIPQKRLRLSIIKTPFIPEFESATKTMHSNISIPKWKNSIAKFLWLLARSFSLKISDILNWLDIHKQWSNRLLEPWMFTECLITSTNWSNFFALRISEFAQPEMRKIALNMQIAYEKSIPVVRNIHIPYTDIGNERYIFNDGFDYYEYVIKSKIGNEQLIAMLVSAARCARVSYINDIKYNVNDDKKLAMRLLENKHMSPFEHQAFSKKYLITPTKPSNLDGVVQFRKIIKGEC